MNQGVNRIVIDPAIKMGKPVIAGTRVPVELVIGQLASGMTNEQVCAEYNLTVEDIKAALSYAAQALSSEIVVSTK